MSNSNESVTVSKLKIFFLRSLRVPDMEGREGQHHRHPSNTRMWWMIVRQRLGGIPGPGSWFRFQPLQVSAMDKDSNTATLHCNSSIVIKKKQSKVECHVSVVIMKKQNKVL